MGKQCEGNRVCKHLGMQKNKNKNEGELVKKVQSQKEKAVTQGGLSYPYEEQVEGNGQKDPAAATPSLED